MSRRTVRKIADLASLDLPDGTRVDGRIMLDETSFDRTIHVLTHRRTSADEAARKIAECGGTPPEPGSISASTSSAFLLAQPMPDGEGLAWARTFMRTLHEFLLRRPGAVRYPELLQAMVRALPPPPPTDEMP